MAAAASPDAETDRYQHCEAWYFAGMKKLIGGEKAAAIDYFRKSLSNGKNTDSINGLAQTEWTALAR